MASSCDPVGCLEIAERLGVNRATPYVWVQRGRLPEPRWTVNGGAAWNWPTIQAWAKKTGRLGAQRA